jgi:pimeloyl-ACP methyl ester carboxylesterase
MQKIKRNIKSISYWILIVFLLLLNSLHVLDNWMQFSDQDILEFFNGVQVPCHIHYLDSPSGKIRIIESGSRDRETAIIAIHGAPGSWDAYKKYLADSSLLKKAHLIAYDRPGYGKMYRGNPVQSLESQATFLHTLIQDVATAENIILLSHSYGGPIAAKYMAMFPDSNLAHLMIAPAIDPETEKYFWVSPLGYWKLTKWLLPKSYISASYEKCTHEKELKLLRSDLLKIEGQTYHIHGMKDWLAPPEGNINFVEQSFPPQSTSIDILDDGGHLLIWDHYEYLVDKLLNIIE